MSDLDSWSDDSSDGCMTLSSAETVDMMDVDTPCPSPEHRRVRVSIRCTEDEERASYLRLLRRNRLLATLCGFERWSPVIDAAVRIQSHVRGFLLRRDKRVFDRCVVAFLSQCRMILQRGRYTRIRRATCTIQAYVRGKSARATRCGRMMTRLIESRREIAMLELAILRMRKVREDDCRRVQCVAALRPCRRRELLLD